MAWLSRINFTAADVLSYAALNNLGNDDRAWGGDVNGGGFKLSNVVFGTGISAVAPFVVTSSGGSTLFTVLNNGNVGIGTANPGFKLECTGTVSTPLITFPFAAAPAWTTSSYIWAEGSFGTRYDGYNHRFDIGGSRTEAMRITSAGRVGIGTGTPVSLLDVYNVTPGISATTIQNLSTTNTNYGLSMGVTGAGAISNTGLWINVGGATSNAAISIIGPAAGASNYAISSTCAAQSYFAGRVGIGDSAPGAQLSVVSYTPSVVGITTYVAPATGNNIGVQANCAGVGATTNVAFVATAAGAGTNVGLKISGMVGGANNWAIYSEVPCFSYFANALLIGYLTTNGPYNLQVNSQIFATSSTIATSDGNYKQDVEPIKDALLLVNALNPVTFNWKRHPVHNFDLETGQIGFVAQDVEKVLGNESYCGSVIKHNSCKYEDAEGKEIEEPFLGIAEGNLVALLCAAIQELTVKVLALEAKIQ